MKLSSVIYFLFLITFQTVVAQKNEEEGRFTASVIAGINFSQIDGDEDGTYSKVGFNGGARGGVRFGKNMELKSKKNNCTKTNKTLHDGHSKQNISKHKYVPHEERKQTNNSQQ